MAGSPVTPPLLAVALVFRPRPDFDAITHVISAVSAYADSSVEQPLHKACKFGSVALLDRIWNTTVDLEPDGWGLWSVRNLLRSQKLYGKYQFTMCLLEAAKTNSVDIARWLFERFPYDVRRKVICEAAKAGALKILRLFRANGTVIGNDEKEEDEYAEERERLLRARFGGLEADRAAVVKHATWIYAVYEDTAENAAFLGSKVHRVSGATFGAIGMKPLHNIHRYRCAPRHFIMINLVWMRFSASSFASLFIFCFASELKQILHDR